MPDLVVFSRLLAIEFPSDAFTSSSLPLTKREAAILKSSASDDSHLARGDFGEI